MSSENKSNSLIDNTINVLNVDYGTVLPINDLMFKRIFWNKEHPDILISFVNAVLKREDPITSVELISTELDDKFIGEHGIRLDLVGRTNNGDLLNIEMQNKNSDDMFKRSLYYWSKLYSAQLRKGQKYSDLCPVIAINILDFNLFKDNRCHRSIVLKDEETNEVTERMLEIHFVELKKRQYMDQNDDLWVWAEFLKSPNSSNLNDIPEELKSVSNAKEIFTKALADPAQQNIIRMIEKTEMDNLSSITKARENGLAEGEKKGEHKKAIETAKKMLSKGSDIKFVSECTGLTIEEIKKL